MGLLEQKLSLTAFRRLADSETVSESKRKALAQSPYRY